MKNPAKEKGMYGVIATNEYGDMFFVDQNKKYAIVDKHEFKCDSLEEFYDLINTIRREKEQ